MLSNVIPNRYPGLTRRSDSFFGIIPALIQPVQARRTNKNSPTKSRIRFLTGLGLLCGGLFFPVPSASSLPIGGITVETTVTLSGYNTIDSYDSSNPSYSLWHSNWWFQGHNFGTYTNAKRTDQVVVGTDANGINLNAGDVIYGYLDTGPAVRSC